MTRHDGPRDSPEYNGHSLGTRLSSVYHPAVLYRAIFVFNIMRFSCSLYAVIAVVARSTGMVPGHGELKVEVLTLGGEVRFVDDHCRLNFLIPKDLIRLARKNVGKITEIWERSAGDERTQGACLSSSKVLAHYSTHRYPGAVALLAMHDPRRPGWQGVSCQPKDDERPEIRYGFPYHLPEFVQRLFELFHRDIEAALKHMCSALEVRRQEIISYLKELAAPRDTSESS